MNLWYWLRRPHLIPARLRYWAWERRNPDKPWLTPGAVAFCAAMGLIGRRVRVTPAWIAAY